MDAHEIAAGWTGEWILANLVNSKEEDHVS